MVNEQDITIMVGIFSTMTPRELRIIADVMTNFADIIDTCEAENIDVSNFFSGAMRVYLANDGEASEFGGRQSTGLERSELE